MPFREFHYSWDYDLKASPEKLWPFVADTNRFNRDTGVPSVQAEGKPQRLQNARQRLRLSIYGMDIEWEEQPFEWVRPVRFGVVRNYSKGPMAQLRALAVLTPLPEGGTRLTYSVWAKPKSLLGMIVIPLQMKLISAGQFARAFRKYDEQAAIESAAGITNHEVELPQAARARSRLAREKLVADGADADLIDRLIEFTLAGDEFAVAHMRPYILADEWMVPRRAVLETCLRATRAGLLDLQWDLLCPLCRGVKETGSSLREISSQIHCAVCRIDAAVNFDRFVEVTFRPNALLRRIEIQDYCMGSPERTPHVVAQQLLPANSARLLTMPLEPGRYRLRTLELAGGQDVTVSDAIMESASLSVTAAGWPNDELRLGTDASLRIENATDSEQLFILERTAWSDQAATAAEVTALQVFRDLFSSEALRPGQQISVGTLTVLFTDLRNSTRMYREIGDATAFGRVMNHFEVLKQAIAAEDGALVKTIGDAVMAVFREPENALRAMLKAQQILAAPADGSPGLILKAGLHAGPCIAVTLNDRLDYFGSTVNLAARLEGLSTGNDVIISRAVFQDPEVAQMIEDPQAELAVERFEMPLKGFDEEQFELWRVGRRQGKAATDSLA